MKAIDQVCLLYPVDRARVAVAGLSAGASMAALLVTRHPERFKAVVDAFGHPAGHGAFHPVGARCDAGPPRHDAAAATPVSMAASWPPLMVIHGDVDRVVSASNGHAAVQVWADAAGARASTARNVQRGKRYAMTVTDFKRKGQHGGHAGRSGATGHAWSGGAATQPFSDGQGPDASRMAWAFAAKQFGT